MNVDDVVFACVECDFELPVGVGVVSIDLRSGDVSEGSIADELEDEDLPPCPKCGADTAAVIDEGGD
jgi:hypothetical protein